MHCLARRFRLVGDLRNRLPSVLGGCASTGKRRDPLEPMNRAHLHLQRRRRYRADEAGGRGLSGGDPAAGAHRRHQRVRQSERRRRRTEQSAAGQAARAFSDISRVLINTTAGLFGIFDVATEAGLEKHDEDFGQTLGWWGIGDGPYLVLPFLGPSTVRDFFGKIIDWETDPTEPNRAEPRPQCRAGLPPGNPPRRTAECEPMLEVAALDRIRIPARCLPAAPPQPDIRRQSAAGKR